MLNQHEILSDHPDDRPAASGRAYHHHGHLPAGLRRPRRQGAPATRSMIRSPATPRTWSRPARTSSGSSASPSSTSASPSPPSPWWPAAIETEDYVPFALALDRAAKTCGVNFIGGYLRPGAEGHDRRPTGSSSAPSPRRWPSTEHRLLLASTWAPPRRASTWTPWR